MKKVLLFLLALSLFLPTVSYAGTVDYLIGAWIGLREEYPGDVSYFLVDLYDDYTALYESNSFTKYDNEGFQIIRTGTWDFTDGVVHVRFKNYWDESQEDDFELELTQDHYLAHKLAVSYILFSKMQGCRKVKHTKTVKSWD
ncbi:MAG: hypothetical protein J6U01_05720 [Clostridia bacterium]|nr:hypothetical protein [Clostridia bacterium]